MSTNDPNLAVPSPRTTSLSQGTTTHLERGSSGRVRVFGPSQIKATLSILAEGGPWFPVVYAGTDDDAGNQTPPAARVTVDMPGRDTPAGAPASLPESGYRLLIERHVVRIEAPEISGVVNALRTLSNLEDQDGAVPTGSVDDSPAFAWRGIHFDVARHFFGPAFLKRLLRVMAWLGFNVFHWHLTEDQGWRIPVPGYPRLAEVAAFRENSDGTRHGGIYSPQEITDIVEFAGSLGILVVPEIELPGHARAAIAAYRELSCRKSELPVSNTWGIHDDVFCAGSEEVFAFLDSVFDETCRLFPSGIIHIGGDECPKTRWSECPACAQRMDREGIADYESLQSYFITRAAQMLESRGRSIIGWDEILEGGIPAGAIVMSWRGTAGGIAAAKAGHKVVMTPTSHCYFDYRQVDSPDATGFAYPDENGVIPVLPIDTVLEFDPLAGLGENERANVLGGQANVWTEQMPDDLTVEQMISPRIIAMAEALWSAPDSRDFETFKPRAAATRDQLARLGWHSASVPELP